MNILEQELEELIFSAIECGEFKNLRERGLPIYDEFHYVEQLCLGNYGRADIVGFHTDGSSRTPEGKRIVLVQIYELKKEQVDYKTFLQAVRYAKGITEMALHESLPYEFKFSFHLIGKSIDTNTPCIYLADFQAAVNFYTYSLSLNKGLTFNQKNGYKLSESGFTEGSAVIKDILITSIYNRREQEDVRRFFANQPPSLKEETENIPF